MNRYPILITLALVILAVSALLNCADPLESVPTSPSGGSTQVPDTIIRHDTVTDYDTVTTVDTVIDTLIDTVHDTNIVIDTVIDTVIHIDTVIVVQPDSGTFRPLCAQLSSSLQEIVWMFRNPAGNYHLEFAASVERAQPNQSLTVTIDGREFQWDPNADAALVMDQYLGQHAKITVVPNKPPAHGHSIDICLTVTPL